MGKSVYIVCPVRGVSPEQHELIKQAVEKLEMAGDAVFWPERDALQSSNTGYEIVIEELEAIKECDEVHLYWDVTSKGSHFDLGAALALKKKVVIKHLFHPDGPEKSYVKVVRILNGDPIPFTYDYECTRQRGVRPDMDATPDTSIVFVAKKE